MRARLERELERVEAYRVQLEREARLAAELRAVRETLRPPSLPSLPSLPAVGTSGQFTVPAFSTDESRSSTYPTLPGSRARSAARSFVFIVATAAAVIGLSTVQWDRWPAAPAERPAAATTAPQAAPSPVTPVAQCSTPPPAPLAIAPATTAAAPAPLAAASPTAGATTAVAGGSMLAKRAKGASRRPGSPAATASGARRATDATSPGAPADTAAPAGAAVTAGTADAPKAGADPARSAVNFDQAKRTAELLREQLAGSMP